MRAALVAGVRASFEQGIDDPAAEALLDLVVGDVLADAARELAKAIGPQDVASQRRAIHHDLLGAMAAATAIASAYAAVGNPAAGCAELLAFLRAFSIDLDERARAMVRRDGLQLDRQVADATRRCRWRGGRRAR